MCVEMQNKIIKIKQWQTSWKLIDAKDWRVVNGAVTFLDVPPSCIKNSEISTRSNFRIPGLALANFIPSESSVWGYPLCPLPQ